MLHGVCRRRATRAARDCLQHSLGATQESHGEHSFVSEDVSHGNKAYYILTWGKALFVRELLARNYSVLLSDLDTVWLKNALR